MSKPLEEVIHTLERVNLSPSSFFIGLLNGGLHSDARSHFVHEMLDATYALCKSIVFPWAWDIVFSQCEDEISTLTSKTSGIHFNARSTTVEQIRSLEVGMLGKTFETEAPSVWELLGILSDVTSRAKYQRNLTYDAHQQDAEDVGMGKFEAKRDRLLDVRKVTCISILLHSSNQRCNSLQTLISLFLHAANAPETVHELLSSIGLAVSMSTTHNSINNLSLQMMKDIRTKGQTMHMLWAFDNVDIYMRHPTPTIGQSDTLIHLTSAIGIPLISTDAGQLQCYTVLQDRTGLRPDSATRRAPVSPERLLVLYDEPMADRSGLRRRERFYVYKFLQDLISYGPDYFHKFATDLEQPETVEQIPIIKSEHIPLKTLDINPSTISGHADILTGIFNQAGIGDASENPFVKDIGEHVVLVSGDLLTGERIRSLQQSRSIEATKWRRFDFVVFVMGLFHLKMACADAIWRLFIRANKGPGSIDSTSLIELIGQIRPRETGKFTSGPSFRALHEAIQHIGAMLRLDCWRKAGNVKFTSLKEFASSKPSWSDLISMAIKISKEYVGSAEKITSLRRTESAERDKQNENILILQQYLLLYEETSYAMNAGDIGRLESTFCSWIWIFNCCGKNKYASELRRYLEDVHFIYLKEISKAIRMNILCNPSGRTGAFRAIDWVVEHHNLFLKRVYGGKFSNHTTARIIKESCLIEMYRNIRVKVEQMFQLNRYSSHHSLPEMDDTLMKLAHYIEQEEANTFIIGRNAGRTIPNAIADGMVEMFGLCSKLSSSELWADLPDDYKVDEGDLDESIDI